MNSRILILAAILCIGAMRPLSAQPCSGLTMVETDDMHGTCKGMNLALRPDARGRPYLYLASKENGLQVQSMGSLVTLAVLPSKAFDSLDVMNISQQGNYLYVALGNHFGTNTQTPGVAIVDVTDPTKPAVTDIYKYPASSGGCGIVKAEGDYAYMGAMLHGLVILDISDKHAIKYVSEIMPDRNFPAPKPDTLKYNARGMVVRDGIVYLCFDAGGVRVINTTDKAHPTETGRYSAPEVLNRARAYNNLVLADTLLYVACDYCGMEVLSVADTAHIRRVGWWNPWHCEGPANNWFNSSGYANEIEYLPSCKLAFISAGRTPLEVVDLHDPTHPDSCSAYPGPISVGSWGVSLGADRIYLSYVCALIPFVSASTGIKVLSYTAPCASRVRSATDPSAVTIVPQPATTSVRIISSGSFDVYRCEIEVYDVLGKRVDAPLQRLQQDEVTLDVSKLSRGTYYVRIADTRSVLTKKLITQ